MRAIPTKIGGVFCLLSSILVLLLLPLLDADEYTVRDPDLNVCFKFMFMLWVLAFILLGWLGAAPMEAPYIFLSKILVTYHFFFFLIYIPIIDRLIVYWFYPSDEE